MPEGRFIEEGGSGIDVGHSLLDLYSFTRKQNFLTDGLTNLSTHGNPVAMLLGPGINSNSFKRQAQLPI